MKNKKLIGLSLVVSAFTMLLTLFVAPSSDKKTSRFLSAFALIAGLVGALMACEQACCRMMKKKAIAPDEGEDDVLFDEDGIEDVTVIHAESEERPILHCDVPCDEEATEEDFI